MRKIRTSGSMSRGGNGASKRQAFQGINAGLVLIRHSFSRLKMYINPLMPSAVNFVGRSSRPP